jgi:hypothetical protein
MIKAIQQSEIPSANTDTVFLQNSALVVTITAGCQLRLALQPRRWVLQGDNIACAVRIL